MSHTRAKQCLWREVLDEVKAQQTIIDSILHPDRRDFGTQQQSQSFTASSALPQGVANTMTPQGERSYTRVKAGGQPTLLSPCLDAAEDEDKPTSPDSFDPMSGSQVEQKGTANYRRGGSAAESGSKVVEALVEALSTSSWSSESNAAVPGAPDELSPVPHPPETPAVQPEMSAVSSNPVLGDPVVAHAMAAQKTALQSAPFYLQATQIAANEFEDRQHIMFNEFTAVTELISLFVCHMSHTSASS